MAAPPILKVRLTRLTNETHRFEYVRPDGTGEAIDMETRSLLFHDLVHFALETEASLKGSFYGLLGKVGGYRELILAGEALGGEAQITETVVGPLQSFLKTDGEPEAFVERMAEIGEDLGRRPIPWLTADFVARVRERVRRLEGEWKATPFGKTMELSFELRG